MVQKELDLKEWARKASLEWKHIPSLKGKQAIMNLSILRILATSPTPKSAWDLALEYLKRTESKFSFWDPNMIYKRRMLENSKMNRRLHFLEGKQYVKKLGSIYKLCPKGMFLLLFIDPKILRHLSPNFLNDDSVDVDNVELPKWFEIGETKKDAFFKDTIEGFDCNLVTADTFSFTAKKIVLAYKINMDDISSKDLIELLNEKVRSRIK